MLLYELIDLEYPICLYCKHSVTYSTYSEIDKISGAIDQVYNIKCNKCPERFEIFVRTLYDKYICSTFLFTCLNFNISDYPLDGKFRIQLSHSNPIWVPAFNIDFSDKNKLFEKLSTYIFFI